MIKHLHLVLTYDCSVGFTGKMAEKRKFYIFHYVLCIWFTLMLLMPPPPYSNSGQALYRNKQQHTKLCRYKYV